MSSTSCVENVIRIIELITPSRQFTATHPALGKLQRVKLGSSEEVFVNVAAAAVPLYWLEDKLKHVQSGDIWILTI